jgi:hypothetical protein
MKKRIIALSEDKCVAVEGDWHLHFPEPDAVLRGIFSVAGHDYFGDGRPLNSLAPRILSVVGP